MIQINIGDLDGVMFTWFYADILQMKNFLMKNEEAVITLTADISHVFNLGYGYNPNPKKAVFYEVDSNNCVVFSTLQDGWNGLMEVNENSCLTYEVFWTGEFSGCSGKGPVLLQRK